MGRGRTAIERVNDTRVLIFFFLKKECGGFLGMGTVGGGRSREKVGSGEMP